MPRCFSIKLHSETQISSRLGVDPLDMPRTPYRASEGKMLSISGGSSIGRTRCMPPFLVKILHSHAFF